MENHYKQIWKPEYNKNPFIIENRSIVLEQEKEVIRILKIIHWEFGKFTCKKKWKKNGDPNNQKFPYFYIKTLLLHLLF